METSERLLASQEKNSFRSPFRQVKMFYCRQSREKWNPKQTMHVGGSSETFPSRTKPIFRWKKKQSTLKEKELSLILCLCILASDLLCCCLKPIHLRFPRRSAQVLARRSSCTIRYRDLSPPPSTFHMHRPLKPNCRERRAAVGKTSTAYGVQKQKLSRVSRVAESLCTLQRYWTVSNLSLVCFCLWAIVSFESSSLGATNNCTQKDD